MDKYFIPSNSKQVIDSIIVLITEGLIKSKEIKAIIINCVIFSFLLEIMIQKTINKKTKNGKSENINVLKYKPGIIESFLRIQSIEDVDSEISVKYA